MSDILDAAFGDSPEASSAADQVPVTPEPAPDPTPSGEGPARGADGKFVAKSDTPSEAMPAPPQAAAPTAETPPVVSPEAVAPPAGAPAEESKPPPGFVPAAEVKKWRERAQSLERQFAETAPDPAKDLEGFQAHQRTLQTAQAIEWSFRLGVQQHGEEVAQAARDWAADRADDDPAFYEAVCRHPDPFAFFFGEYQRHQALDMFADPKVREDFAAWRAAKAAPLAPARGAPAAPAPQLAPTPPPSLAAAGNAGGTPPGAQPVYPGAAFDRAFT